jgi:hypothetical protein
MPKKSKSPTIFSDGKTTVDFEKIRELEDVLGLKEVNPFGTNDFTVFKENLSDMTLNDMQQLARKAGIFASGSRDQLKTKLINQFKIVSRGSSSIVTQRPAIVLDPKNPKHAKTIQLLEEGFVH